MQVAQSCPSKDTLERFVLGQLAPAEVEHWAPHVEGCDRCLTILHKTTSQDAVVEAMKHLGAAGEQRQHPLVQALIEQLNRWSPEVQRQTGDEDYPFLAPPCGPDEIGWLGPYRVLKVLGSGGMGVVFQAEDPKLKRLLAVKTLRPALAAHPDNRRRFLREAQAAAQVQSDYIVPIYQIGEDRGVPFLAMPFLQGCSLEERLQHGEPLALSEVVRVGAQVARGLAAAHERGLVHRDIKPANLWLEPEQGGRVKILDFGLARMSGEDVGLTTTGAILGTPAYMAPEQARGQKVDGRCDLFSLGGVLYRLLTGQMPFSGQDTMSILLAVVETKPAPPRALNPAVPQTLSDLVLRLLAKNPADRPQNAKAVIKALEEEAEELSRTVPCGAMMPDPTARHAPTLIDQTLATSSPQEVAAPGRRRWLLLAAGVTLLGAGAALLASWNVHRSPGQNDGTEVIEPGSTDKLEDLASQGAGLVLDPAQIPVAERFSWQPKELVAVIGEHRARHWGRIYQMAWSPDDRFVATISDSGLALWDPRTLHLRALLPGSGRAVAFSPDGQLLAAGGGSCSLALWDLAGDAPKERAVIPESLVMCLAFAPNGRTLAGGCKDRTVRLWDVAAAKPKERAVLKGHTSPVVTLAFAPDGQTLATGGEARQDKVHLWDVGTREPREKAVVVVDVPPRQLAFTPDSKTLAASRLWDVTGAEPKERSAFSWVGGIAFSPDGQTLAISAEDGVYLRDLTGGRPRPRMLPKSGPLVWIAFAPDGKHLITADSIGGLLRLWDPTGDEPWEQFKPVGHYGPLGGVVLTPEGKTLATFSSWDPVVRLWDLTGAAPRRRAELRGRRGITGIALSPDGATLAVSDDLGTTRLWDLGPAEPLERASFQGGQWPAFSPDGKTLAVVQGTTIRLLDVTGAEPRSRGVLPDCRDCFVFTPDGRTLLCRGAKQAVVRRWDLSGDAPVERTPFKEARGGSYLPPEVSPDGKWLAWPGLSDYRGVFLWELNGQRPAQPEILRHDEDVLAAAFTRDGRQLAVGQVNGLSLWDLSGENKKRIHTWRLPGRVNRLAFTPDGRHLITANTNGTAYILRVGSEHPYTDNR
jgi:serine/threonine protein kinase/WD40 repeat protein